MTTRRDTYHHGDLRRALVDTATAMLAEGVDTITLREVARRAGVSAAAPYNHFANKRALVSAVAAEGLQRIRARLDRVITRHRTKPPEALLGILGEAYVRFAFDFPAHFGLIFGPDGVAHLTDAVHDEGQRTKNVLRVLFERWQADGVIGRGDLDEQVRLAWSTAHGIATLLKGPIAIDVRTAADRRRLAHAAARMVLRGLRQPA